MNKKIIGITVGTPMSPKLFGGNGEGGGGLTEVYWKDIKDAPFYDNRVIAHYSYAENPNPVSFDIALLGVTCYKVSDLVPTRDEIFNELIFITDSLNTYQPFDESGIVLETEDFIYLMANGLDLMFINKSGTLNASYSGYPISIDVPETGIYYLLLSNISIPEKRTFEFILGNDIKQIDLKYIPENAIRLEYSELSQVEDNDINYTIPLEKSKEIYQRIMNNEAFSIIIWQEGNSFSPIFNHTSGGYFYTIWGVELYSLRYNHSRKGFKCTHTTFESITQEATPFSLRRTVTPPLEELMALGEESMIERGLV